MRIASYSIEQIGEYVGIKRYLDGQVDSVVAWTFKDAVDYLTIKNSARFSVVWNMDKFWKILSSLLPQATQETATKTNKAFFDNVKIYYVGRMLGLTRQDVVVKDMKDKLEVNIFPLNSWLAETREEPDVKELASLGEQVLDAMDTLGIPVTTLTSPAGNYAKSLIGRVPTIFSNPKLKDISNFLIPALNLEWTETYQSSLFAPTFTYDQVSAYPFQMTLLRNTDNCKVVYSPNPIKSHYAIVKISDLENVPDIHPLVSLERDIYASPEIKWLKEHGAKFNVLEGYYITWLDCTYPFKDTVMRLYETKQRNDIVGETSKRCVNGISGKFDQQNADGSFGELYNPLLALIVRVGCRMADWEFIEQHKLIDSLTKVHVDSISCYKDLQLPSTATIGQWRKKM